MPFVFGAIGLLLIVSGVRGQSSQLFSLVKSDFSGSPNYFEWMVAIFLVGAIGYIKQLSTISRMFMFLVLLGLLYKNKQVFSQLETEETQQPSSTTTAMQSASTNPTTQAISSGFEPSNSTGGLPALPSLPELESDGGF